MHLSYKLFELFLHKVFLRFRKDILLLKELFNPNSGTTFVEYILLLPFNFGIGRSSQ